MLDKEDRSMSSFKLRIDAFSLLWNGKEFPLLESVLGTPRMTVRDGPNGRRRVLNRREGCVQILYLDDTMRITVSNSGLLFLHERTGTEDEDFEKT